MKTEALVVILVLISTGVTVRTDGFDVKQFVNTSEKIWTYKTTSRAQLQCEVNQLEYISALSIIFKRSSFFKGKRSDFRIEGLFDTDHKERMTLLSRGTFRRVETMLYMAHDYSCAVFKVDSLTNWRKFYYDLRMRNSSLRTRPSVYCRIHYEEVVSTEYHHQENIVGCVRKQFNALKMRDGCRVQLQRRISLRPFMPYKASFVLRAVR
ncbi:uncharacterized protein LOC142761726 isoform X1 [Rhipicephalus microplus]|uniref:uncharacterized protein LOC142761726 isoform X1 n=1 Tax=Rhipicephalus microplus TaxID=6941 RepID=UPI003F6DA106